MAALNEKMTAYALNPTAENMIAWLGPAFGFREAARVRELAYRNADGLLDARSRWSLRSNMAEIDPKTKYAKWDGVDEEGYPKIMKRRTVLRVLGEAMLHPVKSTRETARALVTDPGKVVGRVWERTWEDVRIFWEGKAAMRGYAPLDAWAKKNFIEKMWHTGLIDWWMKERLMTKHVAPKIPVITPIITGWLDSDSRWLQTAAVALAYAPGLITRPAFLYLWIHDWGKAQLSFWNEVVAPAVGGEQAKALQLPQGK